ncbi:MAG: PEGA domain-containing protein [Spirochaetaceae bacterium]|jgi:hypothetical protein|nr:PEGA domain-containing protein [Spirochaetaceae bacterium]GMO29687.1 MAG: hypothetical protein Pg6A_18100 [Termitinemataceae bacterium]
MSKFKIVLCVFAFLFPALIFCEDIRVQITDTSELSKDKNAVAQLGYNEAAAVFLDKDTRFLRGIEIELTAPQYWLSHHGALAIVIYTSPNKTPVKGNMELVAKQIRTDIIANRIQTVYQIPVRKNHGLRNTPYATVLSTVLPSELPLIVRIMPIAKEIPDEVQNIRFQLNMRPILSEEGAVKINVRYPANLQNKPWTMLVDDKIIESPNEEQLLREGEHYLMLISGDYRNESRRFVIERGKNIELNITLQDLTPLIFFEAPDNARIFLDNTRLSQTTVPRPVEPGQHEIKIQVSDYTIIKSVYIQKGRTYRIAFTVDLAVLEED